MDILVVDDEQMMLDAIGSYLKNKGNNVYYATTGKEALDIYNNSNIDIIILDLMLPDMSGESVCTDIRKNSQTPIIMLTARNMEDDMIHGLDIGADDYITKPFSLKNLYARIMAVTRRSCNADNCNEVNSVNAGKDNINSVKLDNISTTSHQYVWNEGALVVDFQTKEIYKNSVQIDATPLEWKILELFMKYPKRVFTREELIEYAFGQDFDGYDRVIDTHIKNIRKKIESNPKKPEYIHTVHGIGYKFDCSNRHIGKGY